MSWLIPWEPSPTLLALLIGSAWLYARGRADVVWPRMRASLFLSGLGLVYLVAQTHLEYFSEHAFFAHRLQHLVLHHLAPFLIVLSHPLTRLRSAMAGPVVRRLDRMLAHPLGRTLHALWRNPLLASVAFVGIVLLWLVPSIHLIAMLDWRIYRLMNASVFFTGLMFFNLCLPQRSAGSAEPSLGTRLTMLIAVMPPQILLGALMFFSSRSFYPVYSLCGRVFPHLSEVADQEIGALILWIPGSMMSIVALIVLLAAEMSKKSVTPGSLLQRLS